MNPASASGGSGPRPRWKTYRDVVATLNARWQRGRYLREALLGEPFEPVRVSLGGPKAADLSQHFSEVIDWADAVHSAAAPHGRVETRTMKTRSIGENEIPVAVWFDSIDQLIAALGVRRELQQAEQLVAATGAALGDEAARWVAQHPHPALGSQPWWPGIIAVTQWIAATDVSGLDLRHVDVGGAGAQYGIDTKFITAHGAIIGSLLDVVLPPERVNPIESEFVARYGFRRPPRYVRFRLLDGAEELPDGISELTLRTDELAAMPLSVEQVFIVENQATYLAFPPVPRSIVIFGGGFGATQLGDIAWLAERRVLYWGDLDLAGFAILDAVRQRLGNVESMLMDRATLSSHLAHVVNDAKAKPAMLTHLTAEESATYRDLVEDRYGASLRLEQERIRFSHVRAALSELRRGDID